MASEFIIDGTRFTNLREFYDHVGSVLIPGESWGRNLHYAFGDILSWTWTSAETGRPYTLIWRHADLSRERLGHAEMARWLEGELLETVQFSKGEQAAKAGWTDEDLQNLRTTFIPELEERLAAAKRGEGQTLFDLLIEIIKQNSKYVRLVLG
jgi:RNAse (barnase) inhibitor barstar